MLPELVKEIAAKVGHPIVEETAKKTSEDSSVDDNVSDGTLRDIDLSSCVTLEQMWPAFLEAEMMAAEDLRRCDRQLLAMDNTMVKAAAYVKQEEGVY